MSSSTSSFVIPGRCLDMQAPCPMSSIEFSLDESGQTAQLRCPADAMVSLTSLAAGFGLTTVRKFVHHGWKVLVVEGSPSSFYRLWKACKPSNLQQREAATRAAMLTLLEKGLTKKAAAALA